MNKVCFKSMMLGAAIVIVTMLLMGAAVVNSSNVNGRYQITSHIYSTTSRVFVIDTQTGEVRSIAVDNNLRPKGYYHNTGIDESKVATSGPWPE